MIVHPGPAHDGPPSAASKAAVERFNDAKKLFAAPDLSPVRVATDPSLVRIARLEDIDGLMALARLMHEEVGIFSLDEDRARDKFSQAIASGVIGVIGDRGLYGCICFDISAAWYSSMPMLAEFMFFVHPEHRRTAYARSLIGWAKYVANGAELPLRMGIFGLKQTDAKVRLCERQLEYVGSFFMHNRHLAQVPPVDAEKPDV